MDIIADISRTLRLTGAVFLEGEFSAPWCVVARIEPSDCAPYGPVPRSLIAYHYVSAGQMVLDVDGGPSLTVAAGEIVLLPRNDTHRLASGPSLRPVSVGHLIEAGPAGAPSRIVHGGGGQSTRILCGFLGSDTPDHPAMAILPKVLKLGVADVAAGTWIESMFRYAASEAAAGLAASPTVLGRLAELLFIEAVRRYVAALPPGQAAWAQAVGDAAIGRAMALLHGQMDRRWTTEDLADLAGMSRSAFADRFARATGEPPMRYLARQRLQVAATRLRETRDPIARIAHEVGYESEAAFNRAFKRAFGAPPASWRRDQPR